MATELKIMNMAFFSSLTTTEQEIYLAHRNSMLTIFPVNEDTKTYDDEIIELVELGSKVFVDLLPEHVRNPPPPLPAVPPTV